MKNTCKSIALVMVLMFGAMPESAVAAAEPGPVSGDRGTDMLVDAVVVRPLGLVATLLGTALTVVALPFTIPSGSVESSAREWIVRPADYTFKRPLGDFDEASD